MVFLVSKETVVLRRWGRSKQKFEFIKLLYRDFNIGGREQAKLDWTLECGIKESRLPKRFLIMDILMFGISAICK